MIPNLGNVKAMSKSLDESVSAILAAPKKWKLGDNTLLIFTSDNGGYLTYGTRFNNISSNGVLRGQKSHLYKGGYGVSTIISWPGRIEPAVTKATDHSVGLAPTIVTVASVGSKRFKTDCTNLGKLLFEGRSLLDRILSCRSRSQAAVGNGPRKLYRNGVRTEPYKLDDIGEQRNLADQ